MLAETARKPKHSKEREQLAQLYAGGWGGGFVLFCFNSVIVQASGQASSILDSVGLYPLQL